jgi:hypothetical protein
MDMALMFDNRPPSSQGRNNNVLLNNVHGHHRLMWSLDWMDLGFHLYNVLERNNHHHTMRCHIGIYRCGRNHFWNNHFCIAYRVGKNRRNAQERRSMFHSSTDQRRSTNCPRHHVGILLAHGNHRISHVPVHRSIYHICKYPNHCTFCCQILDNLHFQRRLVPCNQVHSNI